jgi:hypothetical protein
LRYIQASVSDTDHREFSKFAFNHEPQLSLNQLIEVAIKKYIAAYGQEDGDDLHNQQPTN